MRRSALLTVCVVAPALALAACVGSSASEDGGSAGADTSSADDSGTGGTETESGGTDTGTGGETETETETGEMCTGETCASTLTLSFDHSLDLLAGPYRFLIDTPTHAISCGVEASLVGSESCFGFPFANLSWTEAEVIVVLTNPFYATDANPEGLPFETVMLQVKRGQELLFEAVVPIEVGEPIEPDPCNVPCWAAVGGVTVE